MARMCHSVFDTHTIFETELKTYLRHSTTLLGTISDRARRDIPQGKAPQCPALTNLPVQVRTFIAQAVATPPFGIRACRD